MWGKVMKHELIMGHGLSLGLSLGRKRHLPVQGFVKCLGS